MDRTIAVMTLYIRRRKNLVLFLYIFDTGDMKNLSFFLLIFYWNLKKRKGKGGKNRVKVKWGGKGKKVREKKSVKWFLFFICWALLSLL